MPFEMTVGLLVSDNETYTRYRTEIAPLLEAAGAAFRFDFEIARILKSEGDRKINRLFVLRFPDRAAKERFFADPRYLEIRGRLFEKAVEQTTIVSEHAG